MRNSGYFRRAFAPLAITVATMLFSPWVIRRVEAQEQAAGDKLSEKLANTRAKGVTTLAVFYSTDQPASVRFAAELADGAWARANRGLVQILNVSKETDPAFVKSLGIIRFPTVAVYGRGPKGVGLLATITGCETAEALANRLVPYNLGLAAAPAPLQNDPAVNAANFHHDVYASTQYPPVSTPAPPAAMTPPTPSAPTAAMMPGITFAASPAGLIQVPGQNFVIQQQAPQVYIAPTQAPMVFVPHTMAAMAAPPTGNVFLPTTPAAQPTAMMAPPAAISTPSAAPAPTPIAAAGFPTAGGQVALSNQLLSMPTAGGSTRVRVRGPGFFASGLARMGERMTRLGRARIEMIQSTDLQSPFAQFSPAGLTTISTTTAAPVPQAHMIVSSPPPAAMTPPAPVCPTPPPALPTPQDSPQKRSWFGHN